ncbi:cupin domain-containing protein [Bacillus carboniphilus]|uniref:Cupin domain-containing protein n=1 Tax=Bacillus carboniphilus TaxID=86663 RepID=A0ABY9JV28_9BACI|nr:cupin domain-containing protein [Bacillus carboniphilus]WLR43269.1 cupin domain-containing protein [Bacillus carboniphilus]
MNQTRFEKQVGGALDEVVYELLPKDKTGYVEVQYDTPHQEHPYHTHPTDEILHIIEGGLFFTVDDETIYCEEGDRIYLPKYVWHGSKAGEEGCTYIIAILK